MTSEKDGGRLGHVGELVARFLTLLLLCPVILASLADHPRQTIREVYYIIVGRFEDIQWQRDPPDYEQDWIDEQWKKSRR